MKELNMLKPDKEDINNMLGDNFPQLRGDYQDMVNMAHRIIEGQHDTTRDLKEIVDELQSM